MLLDMFKKPHEHNYLVFDICLCQKECLSSFIQTWSLGCILIQLLPRGLKDLDLMMSYAP